MSKKRRLKRHSYQKPSAAPVSITPFPWDRGADGPAARAMESITEQRGEIDPETGKEINPNGVTGVRRISVAENYYRNGHLTKRQYTAAHALLVAWERKDLTPTLYAERVDSSGKPDDRTAILVDHQTAYIRVSRHVPKKYAKFVYHVARDDCKISTLPGYRKGNRFMEYLRTGLDILADNLEKV